jgi:hypothetical protein
MARSASDDVLRPKGGSTLGKVLGGVLALGVVIAGVWLAVTSRDPEAPKAEPTQQPIAPPAKPKQLMTRCTPAQGPTRVFEFAKPDVKPVWSEPIDGTRAALGFAQTSRLALGLTVTAANLAVSVGERQDDPSPMLSVVPRLIDGRAEFLVERAASRLQTARAVAASTPFAIGLREKTIAARRGKDDVNLWPSPWENLSVPEVARLDPASHAVVIRGGGQRGSVLLGKVSEEAKPLGDLAKLEVDAQRVGEPSLFVGAERTWLAIDGGPTNDLGHLYLGSAEKPDLPVRAAAVTSVTVPAAQPSVVGLPSGDVFLQWTDGPIGAQRIVGRVFDVSLKPRGEMVVLSQPGLDAHHSVSTLVGDRVLSVYFVRLPNAHELWASAVSCSVSEE